MRWEEWKPQYLEIVQTLNLDPVEDQRATKILDALLLESDPFSLLHRLEKTIDGKTVVVCGAGPSLSTQLDQFYNCKRMDTVTYIAADGAISAFLELEIECDILVTDLDGDHEDILTATNCGVLPIVHAHGDNIPALEKIVPELSTCIGSTQVRPTDRVFLWGGFTDGDRACYISAHYCPKKIILLGMDFGKTVGRWSKPVHDAHFQADSRKESKLQIAKNLLSVLSESVRIEYTHSL